MSGCNLIYLEASVNATTMASRTSLNKQNSNSARAAHVCFISLPSLHDYGTNFSNLAFYIGSKHTTTDVPFSFCEPGYVSSGFISRNFTYVSRLTGVGIFTVKFERI